MFFFYQDLRFEIKKIVYFVGRSSVLGEIVDSIVDYCFFESMCSNLMINYYDVYLIDKEIFFFLRKGL